MKILSIEDSQEFQMLIYASLSQMCTVVKANSIAEARAKLADGSEYALILLDVGLPDGDGFTLCTEIKNNPKHANVPIFFLTGKSETINKVMAFNLGAEDYVVKPFDPLELRVRVEARVKKSQTQTQNKVIGGIRIDFLRNTVEIEESGRWNLLDLTTTEYKILSYLVQNSDAVLTRNQIIDYVWGNGVYILDRNVDSHISSLRKKLNDQAIHIKAVHGLGYKFNTDALRRKSA